jgi:hypothetical protein
MDYRFYCGPRNEFPPFILKHLHLLRYIGALMIAAFPIVGMMLLLNVFKLSLFWFFFFFLMGGFGPVFFIIGMAYNSTGDRGANRSILRQMRHFGQPKIPMEYRPERKMIYDHYVAPEGSNTGNTERS